MSSYLFNKDIQQLNQKFQVISSPASCKNLYYTEWNQFLYVISLSQTLGLENHHYTPLTFQGNLCISQVLGKSNKQ
jgi:hypothetical protein